MSFTLPPILRHALYTAFCIAGTVQAANISSPEPTDVGVPYSRLVFMNGNDLAEISDHAGAWSWEDNALFGNPGQGTQPVGWTHTSRWLGLSLTQPTVLVVKLERDANVPWPDVSNPDRKADISSMFPSFTLWNGWDRDGDVLHTYNNRGNVSWAEKLTYRDHYDNSTATSITRSYVLPAGLYTLALGSNAPATNLNRQGFKCTLTSSMTAAFDPQAGGIVYTRTVITDGTASGSFSNHVGAWSWEDNALFGNPGQGTQPVGWTHTSCWMALRVSRATIFTLTLERDASVPWPSPELPDRLADTSSMFPSFTIWNGWDNDGGDSHSYNNRGNVSWAEKLTYRDHYDNSSATSITRSYFLPAGDYTLALGSNAPATNLNRQGFKLTYSSATVSKSDPVPNTYPEDAPSTGGVGYAYTLLLGNGDSGSLSDHVGAWSWEDNALFGNPGQGAQPVGWTHTSCWTAVSLEEASLLTITLERDANVPWPSVDNPDRKADTGSMFPSLTLWKGWDNDGSDSHTYNNRGRVSWAEDLSYVDHIDNSTDTTISRTWRLPAGQYSLVLGSNAPATNLNRQGFKMSYFVMTGSPGTSGGDPVANTYPEGAPSTGGIGYNMTFVLGPDSTSGKYSDHVGAWSWEDNALFGNPGQGTQPVGWTHTSHWIALNVTQTLTFEFSVERDANVPWPSVDNPDRKADTSSMFPSLTLWKGWDNDGGDFHTYNNRGDVDWAEDLTYMDHVDNSTRSRINRSWTLPPGNYTIALGSNAPATNSNRQGFRYSFTSRAPVLATPKITSQPAGTTVVNGKTFRLKVGASGPNLEYQWFKDGVQINDAVAPVLEVAGASARDSGLYHVRIRNAAGRVDSLAVNVAVLDTPSITDSGLLPAGLIGQPYNHVIAIENAPALIHVSGLPPGLSVKPATGQISGRPMKNGNFPLVITAANAAGRSAPYRTTLVINALPTGLVGTFTGNIPRSVSLNEFLGGSLSVTVSRLGAFSGTMKLGETRRTFSGTLTGLNGTPSGTVTLARPGRQALSLTLQYDVPSGRMTGELDDGQENLPLEIRLPSATPSTYQGRHTFALRLRDSEAIAPEGHGLGSFQVAANGLATGTVKLADGSSLTFSLPVENDGGISLQQVIRSKTGMVWNSKTSTVLTITSITGSFLARLIMDGGDEHRLEGSQASWHRLPTNSTLYPAGFGPLDLDVIGGKYNAPRASTVQLAFDHEALDGAPSSPDVEGTLSASGSARFPANPCSVTFALTSSSGLFQGSFQVKKSGVSRKAAYQAVLVDDGDEILGLGFFLMNEFPRAGSEQAQVSGNVSMALTSVR
jgi:hypothetical protein